jgi:TPP-dependent pyruvate/acetoin dehydrogenase alpha subunit
MAKIPPGVGPRFAQVVVLFGATGDLARRKLLPGLYHLATAGFIPQCRVIGVSLDDIDLPAFRQIARGALDQFFARQITDADWDAAEPGLLKAMLSNLVLIRTFEEFVLELAGEGLIHGPAHSSIGQEGGAVGSAMDLTSADTVNGSHRGHHQFIAKVLRHIAPDGIDPTQPYTEEVRAVLLRTLAEICGLDRGFSHGRGGSMHLQWLEAGAIGTNAIVGGGVPLAAGSAWAHRHAALGRAAPSTSGPRPAIGPRPFLPATCPGP